MFIQVDETSDKKVSLTTTFRCGTEKFFTVNESFDSMNLAAKYLMKLLPCKLHNLLASRLLKNVKFISEFEKKLNEKTVLASGRQFKEDQAVTELEALLRLKKQVVTYLSAVTCQIWGQNLCLADNLMHSLMVEMCDIVDPASILISFCKGKLSSLSVKSGFPGSFKNLNSITSAFGQVVGNVPTYVAFENVVSRFLKDFSLNLLQLNTPNQVGQAMMQSELNERDSLSLISASKELNQPLKLVVRYGLLECNPGFVHESSPGLRGGITMDFKKFYLSVLGNVPLLLGQSLKFEKTETGKYICQPTRKRGTFANILFSALDEITESAIYFGTHGSEARNIFPVDGVSIDENTGAKTIFQFLGCFWHLSCDPDNKSLKECHFPVKSAIHWKSCMICQNSEKRTPYDVMKPRLWKLKGNENLDSLHPVKKISYAKVSEQSCINEQKVLDSGNYHRFCKICECTLIGCYYSPLKKFGDLLGLEIKPQFHDVRLCDHLIKIASIHFPLVKNSGKLNFEQVKRGLKAGSISGFTVVDCEVGSVGQSNLGLIRPFAYKDLRGRNESSFAIEAKIVENSYLQFLLNTPYLPDFKITAVHRLYEFKKPCKYIFKHLEEKVKGILLKEQDNVAYSTMLKSAVNSSIGSFAMNMNNYCRSFICTRENLNSVTQFKNMVTSSPLTENLALVHVRNRMSITNLNHLNNQIISVGKGKMIEFSLKIQHFTTLTVSQVNVDGLSLTSERKWPMEILGIKKAESSICLDAMLKPNLCPGEKRQFVDFKKQFFSKLGFCKSHESDYINCLMNELTFEQLPCCNAAINNPVSFEMKIELIFDRALFMCANRYKICNSLTGQSLVKCSGHWDSRFNLDFSKLTADHLMMLINDN